MTAIEAAKVIGKEVEINLNGLDVLVKILDVKSAYGNERYQVSAGLNSVWIDSGRVSVRHE